MCYNSSRFLNDDLIGTFEFFINSLFFNDGEYISVILTFLVAWSSITSLTTYSLSFSDSGASSLGL